MLYLLEILVIFTTIGSWFRMFLRGGERILSRRGYESLKYYTTLSNLFAGIIAVIVLIFMIIFGSTAQMPMWLAELEYAAAVSVGLTFVVVFFLGPRMGYKILFEGEQMCLHAVGPLLAIFTFAVSRNLPEFHFRDTFLAVIPTVLYGSVYAGNILKNGIGEGEKTNDWYGFAAGGVHTIPAAFMIVVAVAWLIAIGVLQLHRLF